MNADDAHSLMLAPMIVRTGNLGSIRHRKNKDYQPPSEPPICPIMPGGRAIAAVLRDRRGKSGLHETTVPDNVRRLPSGSQGQCNREQVTQASAP
jgi:hypothetical protein